MMVMRRALLPLYALLGLDLERTGAFADSFSDGSSSSLSSALSRLNVTVGGRLHSAVPFEKDCFSTVEGKPANASAEGCATLQANYNNPLYRVANFAAYMTVCSVSRSFGIHRTVAHLRSLSPHHSHNGRPASPRRWQMGACSTLPM